MPKLFRMPLVPLGVHHAPQTVVRVSPERAKHWIDSFNAIKAEGNNIPVPWGHQLAAVPHGDADARRFAMARWNASFVERLEHNPQTGGVEFVAEVPPGWEVEHGTGNLINRKDGTRVREASAGIGNWRDGADKVWRDVIIHAALCTLPVIRGQSGATVTLSTDSAFYTATLDTDGVEYLYTLGSETMKKPSDDDMDDLPGSKGLDDLDLDDDLPPLSPEISAPPAATPVPAMSPDAQCITDCMSFASAINLPLPADTTPQNFCERLKVALSTVAAMGWKLQAPQNPMQQQGSQIQTSTDGAQPEQAGPQTYMSTEGETVTLSAGESLIVDAWAQSQREVLGRKYGELEKAGQISPAVANRERNRLPKFKPTVDPVSRRVSLPEARERLAEVQELATGRASTQRALTGKTEPESLATATLSTADTIVEANPARRSNETTKATQNELLVYMAKEAGLTLLSLPN